MENESNYRMCNEGHDKIFGRGIVFGLIVGSGLGIAVTIIVLSFML